jgi:hypothetical protein
MTEQNTDRDDDWEACHLYVLMYEQIDMCGCGWGDDAYILVRDLLDHFHDQDDRDVVAMIGSTGAAQLVLRRLQAADLVDHGTSVTSSWLTEKGRYARWMMHKHGPGDLDDAGYPECYDWREKDDCPEACWVPTPEVPPEPPRPTREELVQRIHDEAEAARAAMNPIQRSISDEVGARMESYMLFGTPEPPEVVGEPGPLMRGVDVQGEADRLRAQIDAARRAGTVDLLSQIAGPMPAPESLADQHMNNMTIYGTATPTAASRPSGYISEWDDSRVSFWPWLERNWCAAVEGVLAGADTQPPAEDWAAAYDPESLRRLLPTNPTPNEGDTVSDEDLDWQGMIRDRVAQGLAAPIDDDPEADGFRRKLLAGAEIPVDEDGRVADDETDEAPNPTGCYEHASGTWIHKPGHPGCPSFLRGKLPSRRRMIP